MRISDWSSDVCSSDLGSPHLANNNRDIANVHVEDVTTPAHQHEIETLVDALARFRPTRIAIEWPSSDQAGLDKRYAAYRAGTLPVSANERDQIALRLAAKLGRSEEHTSELQSLMRISYAVFCLKKKKKT